PQVIENEDGTKTVIRFHLNDLGQKVKVSQHIKIKKVITSVNSAVAARKLWKKFGQDKNKPPGPDIQTTTVGENIVLNLSAGDKPAKAAEAAPEAEEAQAAKPTTATIKCRYCKGAHFSAKCPYKSQLASDAGVGPDGADARGGSPAPGPDPTPGKFVPPHLRRGGPDSMSIPPPNSFRDRDDEGTVRVTNLPPNAEENELGYIFQQYGSVARVHIVRDRETNQPRGFAFITYNEPRSAEKAVKALNRYGYKNVLIHVEHSRK
ncbi:hypothetical protein CANCADRAFT_16662, partial [Tortispora caseinolytica NRRL Y-17796]